MVNAVHTALDENKSTFTQGIAHQGVSREIKSILKSILTPPTQYYNISIHCADSREELTNLANTSVQRPISVYNVELHVSDLAIPQAADSPQVPYETMHQDFRTVVSRIAKYLRETKWLPTDSSIPKYRLDMPTGLVRIRDRTAWFDGNTGAMPILYNVIDFVLLNECGDSGSL